jgi:hypothetical protein
VIEELLQAFINITMPIDGAFNYLEVNDGLLLQQLMAAEYNLANYTSISSQFHRLSFRQSAFKSAHDTSKTQKSHGQVFELSLLPIKEHLLMKL